MTNENIARAVTEIRSESSNRRVLLGAIAAVLGTSVTGADAADASQFCKRCDKHTQCNGDTDYCLHGYCVASGATCNGAFYDFSCETVQRKKSRRWFLCKRNGAFCCNRNGKHCKRAQRLCF